MYQRGPKVSATQRRPCFAVLCVIGDYGHLCLNAPNDPVCIPCTAVNRATERLQMHRIASCIERASSGKLYAGLLGKQLNLSHLACISSFSVLPVVDIGPLIQPVSDENFFHLSWKRTAYNKQVTYYYSCRKAYCNCMLAGSQQRGNSSCCK